MLRLLIANLIADQNSLLTANPAAAATMMLMICVTIPSHLFAGLSCSLVFPAITICLIVLSLHLLGDGLRDAFDPKLKR